MKTFLKIISWASIERTERKWYQNIILYVLRGVFTIFLGMLFRRISHQKSTLEKERNKVKFFYPSIEEGIFTKKVIWTMRAKPLTEEELDTFFKSNPIKL